MVGDTFKETAVLRSDGVFYSFGVIPKLRSLYGVRPDEPIYEVEFEVVEEKAGYPDKNSNDIVYYGFKDKDHMGNDRYSSIQPTAEMFGMQFPWDVWKYQGTSKGMNILGIETFFGIVVRIKPKSYVELKEN